MSELGTLSPSVARIYTVEVGYKGGTDPVRCAL